MRYCQKGYRAKIMAEKRFAKLGLTVVYKAYKIDREGYTKEGKYYGHSNSQPNTVYEWSIQRDDPWEELAYGTDRATSVSALMTKIKSNHKSTFRQGNPTVSVSSLPIGSWEPAHAIRQNADGSIDILREKNTGRRKNISEGFMAGGVFHPIRSAADYDESRVGEKRKPGSKKTSRKKVKVAHSATYAARVKKLKKSHPFELHHKERGFVKGFASATALANEYKRRGGAKNGYKKK